MSPNHLGDARDGRLFEIVLYSDYGAAPSARQMTWYVRAQDRYKALAKVRLAHPSMANECFVIAPYHTTWMDRFAAHFATVAERQQSLEDPLEVPALVS